MHRACSVKSLWQRAFGGKHPFLAGLVKSTLAMAVGSLLLSLTPLGATAQAAAENHSVRALVSSNELHVGSTALWGDTMVSATLVEGLLLTQISTGKTTPFPGSGNTSLASATQMYSLSRNYQTGELWVGTAKEGLWHYQQGAWSQHRLLNSVLSITQTATDGSGKAWVIAGYRELHHFDGVRWSSFDNALTRMAGDSVGSQLRFYTNTNGSVWLTLTTNYASTLPRSFYIMKLGAEKEIINSISGPNHIRVSIDDDGNPWILQHYSSSNTIVAPYLVSTVRADTLCPVVLRSTAMPGALDIFVNQTGLYLWNFGGLYRVEDTVVTRVAPTFSGDKDVGFFIANRFDAHTDSVLIFDSRATPPVLRRFSLKPGFSAKRWNDSTIVAWEEAPGSSQQCMAIDTNNRVWAGMGSGMRIAYRDADSAFQYSTLAWKDLRFTSTMESDERVTALEVGPDNTKWAVCGNSLYSFVDTSGAYTAHPAPLNMQLSTNPRALAIDKNGTIWVAAQSSVARTNLASFDGTTWKNYAIGHPGDSLWVLHMRDNVLFTLSEDFEVAKISLDGQHTLYPTHPGFPIPSHPQSINLLALSDTIVLIGTPQSLYRVKLNATPDEDRSLPLPIQTLYGLFYPDVDKQNPISLLTVEKDGTIWLREKRFGMRAYRYRTDNSGQTKEYLELHTNTFGDPTSEQKRAIRDCAFSTSGILYVIPEAVQEETLPVSTAPFTAQNKSLTNLGTGVKFHYQAGALSFALPAQSLAHLELFNLSGRLLLRTDLSNTTLQPVHQTVAVAPGSQRQVLLARMELRFADRSQSQLITARLPLAGGH